MHVTFGIEFNTTMEAVSSGQHKIIATQTITSKCKFILFYAFKMAVAIAVLRGNSKS